MDFIWVFPQPGGPKGPADIFVAFFLWVYIHSQVPNEIVEHFKH